MSWIVNYIYNRKEYYKIAFKEETFKEGVYTYGFMFYVSWFISLFFIPFLKNH